MKKFATLLLSLVLGTSVMHAQIDATAAKAALDETAKGDSTGTWNTSGVIQLNLNQVNLSNWAAGGFTSVSGVALFNGFANRNMLQFKTQFTEGLDAETGARISDLMSPGYLLVGAGLTYKPNDNFSVFISPAMTKFTFVTDQELADVGAFGVDAATFDMAGAMLTPGANSRFELGGFIAAQYTKQLAENVTFLTRGDLFSNYLDRPQNIDVSWETITTVKISNWFAASFSTLLIYDNDIDIVRDLQTLADGTPDPTQGVFAGPATQFKQALGIGLTFNLK